ncbi:hypothetical protein HDV05_006868, partial [Chytridiales sp. JEL 0842]
MLVDMINKAGEIIEQIKLEGLEANTTHLDAQVRGVIVKCLIVNNQCNIGTIEAFLRSVRVSVHQTTSTLIEDYCKTSVDWKNELIDLIRRLKTELNDGKNGEPEGLEAAKTELRDKLTTFIRYQSTGKKQIASAVTKRVRGEKKSQQRAKSLGSGDRRMGGSNNGDPLSQPCPMHLQLPHMAKDCWFPDKWTADMWEKIGLERKNVDFSKFPKPPNKQSPAKRNNVTTPPSKQVTKRARRAINSDDSRCRRSVYCT